jgi:hypothetical protein
MTLAPGSYAFRFSALFATLTALSGCGDDFAEFSTPGAGAAATGGSSQGPHEGVGAAAGSGSAGNDAGGSNGSGAATGNGAAPGSGAAPGGGSAGTGASAATGGSGSIAAGGDDGAAGEPPIVVTGGPSPQPSMLLDLIDDVEGSFPKLPSRAGRNGSWFSVHDDTAGQAMPVSAVTAEHDTSRFAASIKGAGFTDWGAQMGVALKSPSSGYDASKYCGVRFLVRGSGSGWSFLISDRLSMPQGGVCDSVNWDSDNGCYQFVGKSLAVGPVWQEVIIRFDELRLVRNQQSSRRLETSALYDILFNFHDARGGGYELVVDDLSFLEKGSLACQ